MSFVKHESCPSCGSRDNLARYSDGSAWCFGCHYHERGTESPFVRERKENGEDEKLADGLGRKLHQLWEQSSTTLDERAIVWLAKYGVHLSDVTRVGWRWSVERESLLIPFYAADHLLCCVQEKNFNQRRAQRAKYYNIGNKNEHCTIYNTSDNTSRLVLVEDAVSSLRIGTCSPSMPLLGTYIAKERLSALKSLYSTVVVWLDSDKLGEAQHIAERVELMGLKSKVVFTDLDPKCYTDKQIQEFLK